MRAPLGQFLFRSILLTIFLVHPLAASAETVVDDDALANEADGANWLAYGKTHSEKRYSPPDQINLRQIYHVFEGTEGFVECTTDPEYCKRTDGCATQEVWAQMYDACMEILESTTLEDLARRAKEKREDPTAT